MTEFRDALRTLRGQPAVAALSVVTMALGVGAVTILFALVDAVLLKPLPWPDSDRLVRLAESRGGRAARVRGTISNATFNAWYSDHTTIDAVGGWRVTPTTFLVGTGEPARLQMAAVTPSLFTVLQTPAHLGRVFVEDDGRPGANYPSRDLIVLSFGLWQSAFGGRTDVIGSSVTVSGRPHTIVGVMPKDFVFPDRATQAWTPWAVAGVLGEGGVRRVSIFSAIAKLRDGVTPQQAAAEATSRARGAPDPGLAAVAMFGDKGPADIAAIPALEMITADVRPALLMMLSGVLLLLITSTANVASLQLARSTARRREFAIRAAIGAPATRLARQLAAESTLLGVCGGVLGLLLAIGTIRMAPLLLPPDFPRMDDIAIDMRSIALSAALALGAGVACSVLPAFHARRLNVVVLLTDAASSGSGLLRSPALRARSVIMTAQIAVASVLLIAAALLARSFVALVDSDRGYDPRNLLTARLPLPSDFPVARRTALLETISARMQTVTGVSAVGFGNALPLVTSGGFRAFKMRPPEGAGEVDVNAMQRVISPGYFAAMGLRLVSGRIFTAADSMDSRGVIVVNKSFASTYLGAQPLGAVVPNLGMCRGDDDKWEVVGVVEDMRQGAVTDAAQPEIFMPYAQVGCPAAVAEPIIVVRTTDDPVGHAATLRGLLRQEEPSVALDSLMTMDERVMQTLAKPRLYAIVVIGLGACALTIAGVGLFGVLSYSVAQRSREIGVHMALGARPADVLRLLLRQVAMISVIGIGAGLWVSYAAGEWLTTMLYGVTPYDAATFAGVSVLLLIVIAVATLIPALRAMRIDPVRVLRSA
jgi:putative ABC transport system permease protein